MSTRRGSPRPRPGVLRPPRRRATSRKNLEKAWAALRAHWEKTPARLAASRRNILAAHAALRGRPRKLSPAQLEACRRNVAWARAVRQARGLTPEHLAKLVLTIVRASAARTPEGFERRREKILKHGYYAPPLPRLLKALGDDPKIIEKLTALLDGFFATQNDAERALMPPIARALWRRQRLYHAYAHWENDAVQGLLRRARASQPLDGDSTRGRVYALTEVLMDRERFFQRDKRLYRAVERFLRRLLCLRTGNKPGYTTSRRPPPTCAEKEFSRIVADDANLDHAAEELAELDHKIEWLEESLES